MLGIDLFDPLNSGLERDKSIVSYDYKSFEPVGGKNLTNNRSNTIKLVSKGINQHYLPSEGYLDIVFRASSQRNYYIQAGVNDQFRVSDNGGGNYALATVAPGTYATIGDLNTAFKAAITDAGVGAPAQFSLDLNGQAVRLTMIITAGNRVECLTFFRYLGFLPAELTGIAAAFTAATAFVDKTIMHDSAISLFRTAKLFLNNVEIHSIDYPVFSSTISKLLEYSNNYINTQGEKEWFFTNSTKNLARKDALTAGDVCRRIQIKLNSIFPFLKTYDKVIRGCEIRVELEKNLDAREIVYNQNGNPSRVEVKEATLWMPELQANDSVEASLLDDIVSKKSTVISYENHEVYRQLNTPQSNVTWVLDSLSEVPLFVYIGLQSRSKLESNDIALNPSLESRNPSTYDNLNLVRAECRINGKSYPKLPYQVSFETPTASSTDDYSRLYFEFLRTAMKDEEYDNGSAIDYVDQYKNKYPIITFNLEREEEIQNKRTENNTIEVNLQFAQAPAQDFYINALVVYQNHIVLSTDGKKYEWSRS